MPRYLCKFKGQGISEAWVVHAPDEREAAIALRDTNPQAVAAPYVFVDVHSPDGAKLKGYRLRRRGAG